jgi:hypothetical protein
MGMSAHAEFGESACTWWVLAQLMLPGSGCVHDLRALRVLQIGKFNAHAYTAHA